MTAHDEYTPFGTEWKKEMHRFTKAELIELLRQAYITAKAQKP